MNMGVIIDSRKGASVLCVSSGFGMFCLDTKLPRQVCGKTNKVNAAAIATNLRRRESMECTAIADDSVYSWEG